MSIIDPRSTVRTILGAVTATLDDDATPADILVIYEGGPESLRYLFSYETWDVVISVGRHEEREQGETRRIQDVPLRYNARVPVSVVSTDATGRTAAKMLNKVRRSILGVVEANAQQEDYTIIVQQNMGREQRMGGFDPLWRDDYTVWFRPMEGIA